MDSEQKLETFPAASVKEKNIDQSSQYFLTNIGLPGWCAPHLCFGPFEEIYLPLLVEWPWKEDWEKSHKIAIQSYSNVYVIGSAQENEPIVIKPSNPEVYIFSPCGTQLFLLNTNLNNKLLESINLYAKMVELAIKTNRNAFIDGEIPLILLNKFVKSFTGLEPDIKTQSSVWLNWAYAKCKNA